MNQDILALSNVEIFSNFTAEQFRLLAFGSEKLDFPEGAQIFYDNQPADGGYLVIEGEVELWAERFGRRVTLTTFGPGDLLGELSMFTRNRRIGSATTITAARLLRISRSTMTRVLEEYPELAAGIYDRIGEEVVRFARELEAVESRLAQTPATD